MDQKIYDVLIIGAGPIGIACALEAQKARLDYVVIEKGPIVNSLYHYPTNMHFFSTSEKLEIDDIPFISKAAKPSKQEALEYYRRIATSNDLNINLFEKVEHVVQAQPFCITTNKNNYRSRQIVIATGFYDIPNPLKVPGEELSKVSHYYDDPHLYAFQKVIIVGASNSAVDAALEVYRKGGDVTMVIRGNAIGERVKYWVKPDIENRIKEGSIKAFFNAQITKIEEKSVTINHDGKPTTLTNDFVLALTGYRPNFKFLQMMGINLQGNKKLPVYNDQTMETNVKGVYLAGVICGGKETHKWFIENSRVHARMIVDHLVSKKNVDHSI